MRSIINSGTTVVPLYMPSMKWNKFSLQDQSASNSAKVARYLAGPLISSGNCTLEVQDPQPPSSGLPTRVVVQTLKKPHEIGLYLTLTQVSNT